MKEWNGTQANDPRTVAEALVKLANAEQPSLRQGAAGGRDVGRGARAGERREESGAKGGAPSARASR
jgi:hypothetical protein